MSLKRSNELNYEYKIELAKIKLLKCILFDFKNTFLKINNFYQFRSD